MSVVGSNRPDVHHVLLPSAAAKTSGSPETVKPVTVPVVALAFLPVRNMRGASHVVRRIRLLCQLCSLSLLLLEYVIHVPMSSHSMNNPVVSATVAAVGKYPTFNCQYPSTYPYRDASANVNTRSLFAIPAHCPIPSSRPPATPMTPGCQTFPSPGLEHPEHQCRPYATLLQLMWRSPSAVPSKVPVLWSL
ncbi:hypothetical protein PDIDSM_4882 [Penicillium digitatum]|nr:hypothetical protein PDIDSM_4882 [Penicillium digitatum]